MRDALQALAAQGIAPGDYATYFLNPPGQHGLFPIGGDVRYGIDPRTPVDVLKRTERRGQPPEPGRE